MGNCQFKSSGDSSVASISKSHFQISYAIGRGGFGKVWRCTYKKDKQQYAMKEMAKARVINKRSVASVMNELSLLETMQSDFIVNVHFAF